MNFVGEAVVGYSGANTFSTLWFRPGNFRVWIAPLTSGGTWKDGPGLQHLAKALDDPIRDAAGPKDAEREADDPPRK